MLCGGLSYHTGLLTFLLCLMCGQQQHLPGLQLRSAFLHPFNERFRVADVHRVSVESDWQAPRQALMRSKPLGLACYGTVLSTVTGSDNALCTEALRQTKPLFRLLRKAYAMNPSVFASEHADDHGPIGRAGPSERQLHYT